MRNRNAVLSAAVAAAVSAAEPAAAATYTAVLQSVASFTGGGSSAGNITSSTATWSYDDVTGLLFQTGGTFNVRFTIVPTVTLFRHSSTGLVLGGGGAAAATSFTCTEGNFGGGVGASVCGNYNFGANFVNESTVSWGPGTSTARTLGGDDGALGPVQSISAYDGFSTVSWIGSTLTLSNGGCNSSVPVSTACATLGGFSTGYQWVLMANPPIETPIPAAAWLFGGAVGTLGWLRRRQPAHA